MSTARPTREELIRSAIDGGWDWFAQVEAHLGMGAKPKNQTEIDRDGLARRALAEATARIFAGADGEALLDAMIAKTLGRQVFFTQLGIDPVQAAFHGAFREGMCALVLEILKLIAEGRGDAPIANRER